MRRSGIERGRAAKKRESHTKISSVFGWIDFRRGGKYRRENGVEK